MCNVHDLIAVVLSMFVSLSLVAADKNTGYPPVMEGARKSSIRPYYNSRCERRYGIKRELKKRKKNIVSFSRKIKF